MVLIPGGSLMTEGDSIAIKEFTLGKFGVFQKQYAAITGYSPPSSNALSNASIVWRSSSSKGVESKFRFIFFVDLIFLSEQTKDAIFPQDYPQKTAF